MRGRSPAATVHSESAGLEWCPIIQAQLYRCARQVYNAGTHHPASKSWARTSVVATCPRCSVASSLWVCLLVAPISLKSKPLTALMRKPTYSGNSSSSLLLLVYCAAPRVQHLLRNAAPCRHTPLLSCSRRCLGRRCMSAGRRAIEWAAARQVVSWRPSLMLCQRYPDAADQLVRELEGEPASPCSCTLAKAACQLTGRAGRTDRLGVFCSRRRRPGGSDLGL